MNSEDQFTELEWHRRIAVKLFNSTWNLIDKGDKRTVEENDEMIHSAHASRLHWGIIVKSGKDPKTGSLNLLRGDWQISRVYSLLQRPEGAIYHAQRCLDLCLENGIGNFDQAFAHEALARAYAIDGRLSKSRKHIKLAEGAGENIENEDDKKYFNSEMKTIPSYS
ncbi:MAG: hypothetical protein ACTSR2_05595 [Candidatus Hodarchaeales archaeon]